MIFFNSTLFVYPFFGLIKNNTQTSFFYNCKEIFYADCLLYCSSLATLCYGTKSLDWLSLLLYRKQNFKVLFFFTPSGYILNVPKLLPFYRYICLFSKLYSVYYMRTSEKLRFESVLSLSYVLVLYWWFLFKSANLK